MAERYRRRSALAHLGLEARASAVAGDAGVTLRESPMRGLLVLRGDVAGAEFRGAVAAVLGLEPVVEPLTALRRRDVSMLWLGPDEWLCRHPRSPSRAHRAGAARRARRTARGVDGRVAQPRRRRPFRPARARGPGEGLHPRPASARVRSRALRAVEARQVPGADPPHDRCAGVRDPRAAKLRAIRVDVAGGRGAGVRSPDRAGGVGAGADYRSGAYNTRPQRAGTV